MREDHAFGMQPIPGITRQPGLVEAGLSTDLVQRIPGQWMADAGQMNPNLMRTPGEQVDFEDGGIGAALEDPSEAP